MARPAGVTTDAATAAANGRSIPSRPRSTIADTVTCETLGSWRASAWSSHPWLPSTVSSAPSPGPISLQSLASHEPPASHANALRTSSFSLSRALPSFSSATALSQHSRTAAKDVMSSAEPRQRSNTRSRADPASGVLDPRQAFKRGRTARRPATPLLTGRVMGIFFIYRPKRSLRGAT